MVCVNTPGSTILLSTLLTGVVVTARRARAAGRVRRQNALVDQRLQTPAAVPNRSLPVLAGAATAQVLEFARCEPFVLVLDASASATRAEPTFVQLGGGAFAANRQHLRVVGAVPVDRGHCVDAAARLVEVVVANRDRLLLLLLLLHRYSGVYIGRCGLLLLLLLLRLLVDDVAFQVATVGADDCVARQKAVAVDAQHLLEVRQLVLRDHVERGAD